MNEPGSTATTDDAFLGGALQVLQPEAGYRAGLDAVLLAASVPPAVGVRTLDAGAGVGVVGLAVACRLPQSYVTLVERDPLLTSLARANIARNRLSNRVNLIEADVVQPLGETPELGALAESFDCVLANPPYHTQGRGTAARDTIKANANAMAEGSLDRWARFLASMARPGGRAILIHKAEALPELIAALTSRFGGLQLMPIHPRPGTPAGRVIACGIKGSRAPLQIRPGLVLHDSAGGFTAEVEAILRHGAALDMQR